MAVFLNLNQQYFLLPSTFRYFPPRNSWTWFCLEIRTKDWKFFRPTILEHRRSRLWSLPVWMSTTFQSGSHSAPGRGPQPIKQVLSFKSSNKVQLNKCRISVYCMVSLKCIQQFLFGTFNFPLHNQLFHFFSSVFWLIHFRISFFALVCSNNRLKYSIILRIKSFIHKKSSKNFQKM